MERVPRAASGSSISADRATLAGLTISRRVRTRRAHFLRGQRRPLIGGRHLLSWCVLRASLCTGGIFCRVVAPDGPRRRCSSKSGSRLSGESIAGREASEAPVQIDNIRLARVKGAIQTGAERKAAGRRGKSEPDHSAAPTLIDPLGEVYRSPFRRNESDFLPLASRLI